MLGPLFAQNGAAAGSDDVAVTVHRADGFLLALEEVFHAMLVDDVLQQSSLSVLDDQIHVQKTIAKCLGQQHADSALSGAGHADQSNIFHGKTAFLS